MNKAELKISRYSPFKLLRIILSQIFSNIFPPDTAFIYCRALTQPKKIGPQTSSAYAHCFYVHAQYTHILTVQMLVHVVINVSLA
jgi:hypothetical protein